ncbi:MAG: hypothetical protein AABY15_09755 [Nanoarchaeota archaeon]
MEKSKINKKSIEQLTAEELKFLIRLGHPNEEGYKFERWKIIEEITKRGLKLLDELGWSSDLDTVYRNVYTGGEETLKELLYWLVDEVHNNRTPLDNLFSVIEHNDLAVGFNHKKYENLSGKNKSLFSFGVKV